MTAGWRPASVVSADTSGGPESQAETARNPVSPEVTTVLTEWPQSKLGDQVDGFGVSIPLAVA